MAARTHTRTAAEQAQRDAAAEDAHGEMAALEAGDTVPHDPREWPKGRAKALTFGINSDDAYGDGPTAKLGPAGVEHHVDGSVSVAGKKVDNPQDFKGEPIPGGPTDPNAPKLSAERGRKERGAGSATAAERAPAPPRSRTRRAFSGLGSVTMSAGLMALMVVLVALALAGGASLAGS